MAEVYRAHDRLLDRPVALKVLFPELSVDRSFVERFRREAQAAANLSHPNIVPVFDWGEDSGTYFIVMEFVDGKPLSAILKTAGPLSAERAADIAAPVAAALGYAHKHGVVHRDVKPGNVLITDDGQVKVTDFGIARAVNTEESLTQTGAVMGTATYFSPEQAEGMGVDSRTDIYSLGVVLFEMVTGRPPFLGDTPVAVASKHVRDHPPAPREINQSVPPTFEAIILKAMAKNPDFRYTTAEDLRADLLRFNEGRAVLAMNDETQAMTAMGATQAVGAVGVGATQVVPAQPGANGVEEPKRNRTKRYVIILIVLLVLLAVVGVLLARSLGYLGATPSFNLPNVVGQPVAQATKTLHDEGLTVQTKDKISSAAPNTVLSQDPEQNTPVKKGQSVTLTVAEPAKVTVPSGLVGSPVTSVQQQLQAVGLKTTVKTVTNTQQSGTVLSISPASGASVDKGSTVTLTVSGGPGAVTVPPLSGQTTSQAQTTLGQSNLKLGSVTNQPSASVPSGQVVSSDPAAGAQVPANSPVNIVVSSGPPPPTTTTTSTPPPTTTTTSTPPPTTTTTTGP